MAILVGRSHRFGWFFYGGLNFFSKVVNHEGDAHRDFLHPVLDLRRACLLAYSGHVFLCAVLLDHEEANTVSPNTPKPFLRAHL